MPRKPGIRSQPSDAGFALPVRALRGATAGGPSRASLDIKIERRAARAETSLQHLDGSSSSQLAPPFRSEFCFAYAVAERNIRAPIRGSPGDFDGSSDFCIEKSTSRTFDNF